MAPPGPVVVYPPPPFPLYTATQTACRRRRLTPRMTRGTSLHALHTEQLGALLDGVLGARDGVADGLGGGEDLKVVAALPGEGSRTHLPGSPNPQFTS